MGMHQFQNCVGMTACSLTYLHTTPCHWVSEKSEPRKSFAQSRLINPNYFIKRLLMAKLSQSIANLVSQKLLVAVVSLLFAAGLIIHHRRRG